MEAKKKFCLSDETKTLDDFTVLHRLVALDGFGDVNKGDKGGWVEKESNLSQKGLCWVYDEAMVYGGVVVKDNAMVCEHAIVHSDDEAMTPAIVIRDNAVVAGHAKVVGEATIFNNAVVCGHAVVRHGPCVFESSRVGGNAKLSGHCLVYGSADIGGDAVITGFASVHGRANVTGRAKVMDDVELFGSATVKGDIVLSRWLRVFGEVQNPLVLDGKGNLSERNAGSFLYKQEKADKVLEKIRKNEKSVSRDGNSL